MILKLILQDVLTESFIYQKSYCGTNICKFFSSPRYFWKILDAVLIYNW